MAKMNDEMTPNEAKAMAASEWWVGLPARNVALFQLHQRLLCMPVAGFQRALSEALGRPVFTHELACRDLLVQELFGEGPAPTFDEIIALIPPDKLIIAIIGLGT